MNTKNATVFFALALVAILTIPAAIGNSNNSQTNIPEEEEGVIQIAGLTC